MSEECLELKNINYQTMLLKNNKTNISSNQLSVNSENIDLFLSKEKEGGGKKSWSKLDKASKLKKLLAFSTKYIKKHKLTKNDEEKLKKYLLESLDRKKLQKIKDVEYDIENGIIKNIPNLIFEKEKKKFTLKRDKKNSSLRLPLPRKTHKLKKKMDKKKLKRKKEKSKDKLKKNSKENTKEKKEKTKGKKKNELIN